MLKALLILALLACTLCSSDKDQLKQCISEKCPSEFSTCQAKSGCEDKVDMCADRCGIVVDTACWGTCLGIFNFTAINVCTCAVNQHCLDGSSITNFDRMTLSLI